MAPSSSFGLGHLPVEQNTWVQIPLGPPPVSMTEWLGDGLQNHLCQFDSDSTLHKTRCLAQMGEQGLYKPQVAGSIPATPTKKTLKKT